MARVELLNATTARIATRQVVEGAGHAQTEAALDVGLDADEIRPLRVEAEIQDAVVRHSSRVGSAAWG